MATLLNKEETNHFYKKINSISYHLANKTANMQKLKDKHFYLMIGLINWLHFKKKRDY